MNRVVLCLCLALISVVGLATTVSADPTGGVLAQERVVNLPADQGKWYVSVVGSPSDVKQLMTWFNDTPELKKLKDQVHFYQVTTGTAVYTERYAPNIKGLPTVRLQTSDGTVVYEASGKRIPASPEALYSAMAINIQSSQGVVTECWRRRHCKPNPAPQPDPQNPDEEPESDPEAQPLDDGGIPQVNPLESQLPAWWAVVVALIVGAGIGVAQAWKEEHGPLL